MSVAPNVFKLGIIISHLFQEPSGEAFNLARQADVWSHRHKRPSCLGVEEGKSKDHVFHWNLGPVLEDFSKQFRYQEIGPYLADKNFSLFSFDLGPAAMSHLGILPLSETLTLDLIFQRTSQAIDLIRQYYKGPLAAEIYNYYPTGLYEHVTEADFVKRYLEEFDLGLVLDFAHAAITAHNKGMEALDYFQALPLSRVAEIHISRPYLPNDKKKWAADTHQAPGEREFFWLEYLLKKNLLPPAPVFIEFYEDLLTLSHCQNALAAVLAKYAADFPATAKKMAKR